MKNKGKISILALAFTALALSGCGDEEQTQDGNQPAGDVTVVNTESVDIKITPEAEEDVITDIQLDIHSMPMFYSETAGDSFNDEVTLTPTVYPLKAGARELKWSSNDPTVAGVDQDGKITAIGEGIAEVTVSNVDGTISDKVRVVVHDMTRERMAYVSDRVDSVYDAQKVEGFVVPDVIKSRQVRTEVIYKNDEPVQSDYSEQILKTSIENAYLNLVANDKETRVENGSPVPDKVDYTFYTTDQFETFLFKSSGKVKNYFRLNQSHFMDKTKVDALKAVCDQFFVSGSKILTGNSTDILATNFSDISLNDSNCMRFGMLDDESEVAYDYKEEIKTRTADEKDADNYGVPVGAKFSLTFKLIMMFENNLLSSKQIIETIDWTVGADKYHDLIKVNTNYTTGEKIVLPDKNSYSQVDSAFDL